jgi:hypothetical protein
MLSPVWAQPGDSTKMDSSRIATQSVAVVPIITAPKKKTVFQLTVDSLFGELHRFDSVLNLQDSMDAIPKEPELPRGDGIERTKRVEAWVFLLCVLVLILIGLLRALDPNRHFYALRTPFKSIKSETSFYQRIPGIDLFQMGLIVIHALIFAFALHVIQPFDLKLTFDGNWRNYLLLFLIVLSAYTIKYALFYLIFQILMTDKLPSLLVVSMSNLAYFFSLAAFPLLLIHYYGLNDILRQYLGSVLLILMGAFLIYRFLRLLFLSTPGFPFKWVYIICYLCALEIIPLLVLAKLVGF